MKTMEVVMREKVSQGVSLDDVWQWRDDFTELWNEVGCRFRRCDTRSHAARYVRGLLGRVERKNAWQMAEYLGDASPYAIQHLLDRASWDPDAVRDEIFRYAKQHILTPDEGGALIVDETGFLKKGKKSAGVQRQYSGTAGRIENSQIGVFLALAGSGGRVLIDRELYLPKSWCEDSARCEEAAIPPDVPFATKPQLAQKMLERAFGFGFSPEWVLADEVYGADSKFRRFLEGRGQAYVLAVSAQQRLWMAFRQIRVDEFIKKISAEQWFRMSVGEGAKGPRVYDWAAISFGAPVEAILRRWVLFRRSVEKPEEYAYYLSLAPVRVTERELAQAAGCRWHIESCFEAAKQETGLDEYEVRSWHGWYRHITLSMLALVFLSVVRLHANEKKTA
jgi:SRSO17 transposase